MARRPELAERILEILSMHHLVSAQEILRLVTKYERRYNKTSVYRALDRLRSEGKICEYTFHQGEAVYELRAGHHDHVVCFSCYKVESIPCHVDSHPTIKGFSEIDHHHATFYGFCDTCMKARDEIKEVEKKLTKKS